jgi:hypothetical protein
VSSPTDRPGGSPGRPPSVDDTAAFQRFYLDEPPAAPPPAPAPPPSSSLFHRLFVGWWKDRKG